MGYSVGGSGPVMNPGAGAYYNQQLGLNIGNYNNIQSQYAQAQNNAATQLGDIYQGYGALNQSVLNMLGVGKPGDWGVATPAKEQIDRQYAQSQGQNQQSLINAGLGNSTILSNVMNQGNLQAAQAYGNLGAQLSNQAAGYTSQIGMAGLGARQQGLGMQLGLTQNLMGDLSRFNFAPNVNLYGQSNYSRSVEGGGGGGGGSHYGGDPFTANMLGGSGGIGSIGALGYAGAYGGMASPQGNMGGPMGAPGQYVPGSGVQVIPNTGLGGQDYNRVYGNSLDDYTDAG